MSTLLDSDVEAWLELDDGTGALLLAAVDEEGRALRSTPSGGLETRNAATRPLNFDS